MPFKGKNRLEEQNMARVLQNDDRNEIFTVLNDPWYRICADILNLEKDNFIYGKFYVM